MSQPDKVGKLGTVQRPLLSPQVQELAASDDPALLAGFLLHAPATPKPAANQKVGAGPEGESMSSVVGLDKRLQEVLAHPEFLEMRGVAKKVSILIQTYDPADEDQLGAAANPLRQSSLKAALIRFCCVLQLQQLDSRVWRSVAGSITGMVGAAVTLASELALAAPIPSLVPPPQAGDLPGSGWRLRPATPQPARSWQVTPAPRSAAGTWRIKTPALQAASPAPPDPASPPAPASNPADSATPAYTAVKMPTAAVLPAGQWLFSAYHVSPMAGGGHAGGTGNQNVGARIDVGITDRLQVSGFGYYADDPLFAQPVSKNPNPANLWNAEGGAVQWQLLRQERWSLAMAGSLEAFTVLSGGCGNSGVGSCSPNIFNNSGTAVATTNLVGSIALPISWRPSPNLELSFSPGVSVLPGQQGTGQGGAGTFFSTNVTLSAGALWQATTQLGLFGSATLPLGPGTNSFNTNLEFNRVPVLTGSLRYLLNPRVGFDLGLTNSFGGSPATAVLTLPSSNQVLWMAKLNLNPGAKDSPPLPFTPRSRSLSLGGLTVATAIIPPGNRFNLWASADQKGSMFGKLAYSVSHDLQLWAALTSYQDLSPASAFAATYVGPNTGVGNRIGGKAVLLHQLRGAPFSLAASASFGQGSNQTSRYLYGDLIATREATPWLAININPKLSRSGLGEAYAVGIGANLQLGSSFQLIPEFNIAANSTAASNATLAFRWLANRSTALDVYVGKTAGLLDLGELLQSDDQTRAGARLTVQF